MKLIDKKTRKEIASSSDNFDEIVKAALKEAKKENLEFYRTRIGYDQYIVEVWSDDPVEKKDKAVHLFNVEGVKRIHCRMKGKFINGKPLDRPIKKPKPKPPKPPKP